MTRAAAPKLGGYAGLAGAALLAALVLGLPELVVLAAPFALVLAVGLASAREPQLDIRIRLDADRALEGDDLRAVVELRAGPSPVELAEVVLVLPDGLRVTEGDNP